MTHWLIRKFHQQFRNTTSWAALGMLGLSVFGCAHPEGLVDGSLTISRETLRGQSVDGRPATANGVGVVRLGRPQPVGLPYGTPASLRSSTIRNNAKFADFNDNAGLIDIRHNPSVIRRVSAEVSAPEQVQYPAYPRAGAPCGPACPGCPSCGPCQPAPVLVNGPGVVAWDPTHYPDEYLCDGGDHGAPFHYEGHRLGGLETEDTIAEAYDITGKRLVVPSSQVCIYAPRFGALRTISGTSTELDIQQATGAHDGLRVAGIDTHLNFVEETQRDQLLQFDVRSRASSMDVESRDSSVHLETTAGAHQQQMAAFQNLTTLHEGQFQQSDLAILAYGVQAAGTWTRDENPVIYAHDAHGHELEVEFNAAEYVGTEDKRSPGLLRVVKLADKEIARPGDEITFTLRFQNLGQKELFGIRIVDNLTPRLVYIDGSADSETAGVLDVEPNGEGSSILTFRLDQALAGESSGEITFRCRVR